LIPAAAAILLSSCSKEQLGKIDPKSDVVECEISATLEPQADVRTTLLSDTSVVWSSSDAFVAFGAEGAAAKFTLTEGEGTGSAKFSGTFAGSEPYTLLYPYSEEAILADGALTFKLPHEQKYQANTFAAGSSPAIASCTVAGSAQFHNLCGVLKLTVKGKGQQLKKIVLQDLAGNMLWGDATVLIDGKQGTDEQTMTLTGGDNTLALTMNGITINANTQKQFFFVVPPGTLDRGFSLTFHTLTGVVKGFLVTQQDNAVGRSTVRTMPVATTSANTEPADVSSRGYYKDLFMDGGIYLTSRTTLPSADYLNISMEFFASNGTGKFTATDTLIQDQIFKGYTDDTNGALLYPDGKPRFRLIYVNGGNSREHGKSLYTKGLENIYTFVQNGGSYTGSCAGSFLSSKGYDSYYPYIYYTKVWPGHTYHTRTDKNVSVKDTYTSLTPEPGSPLLNYYNPGAMVNGVRHNGGSYINPLDTDFPVGTEILMRYYTPGADSTKLHGSVNAWAYKASSTTGRVVVSGSHPEGVESGPQLYYMASMLQYAMAGNPPAEVKDLAFGCTASGTLGDLQYHHYKFTLPSKVEDVAIELISQANADIFLTLRKGDKAYISDSQYTLASTGANKLLHIKELEAGEWYVGVYCATTVTSTKTTYSSSGTYYKYTGRTDVLNGVEYALRVTTASALGETEKFEHKEGVWE